jgi:hypothetical protein
MVSSQEVSTMALAISFMSKFENCFSGVKLQKYLVVHRTIMQPTLVLLHKWHNPGCPELYTLKTCIRW